MGRIREFIEIDGHKCWTMFDTGARNTYVTKEVAKLLTPVKLPKPFRSRLGGSVKVSRQAVVLVAKVERHPITTQAMVVNQIGRDDDGRAIEVLFGALAMQQWGIRPIPDQEKLDMTHYPHVFVEF
jgi:hypothetical protein